MINADKTTVCDITIYAHERYVSFGTFEDLL